MDSQINSGHVDEAQEKLFGESNSSGGPKIEIKFVSDPKNGDTKIDISEVRQVFVGMGKEELMKFANDPFWVRMRWLLFILFWALWFGMLAGAIAIILLAPKCSAPGPSKWYEESPIYLLNVKNFMDSNDDGVGDLVGLESKLDYIKDLGVGAILLEPLMKTAEGTDDVIDFKSIKSDYGTFSDLKKLINSAKEKGLHVLMKIIPNFSSIEHDWFNKSSNGEEPYKDYYVWTDPRHDKDGNEIPRNNWLSVTDGSAWTWDHNRKQFYLHQFSKTQPDLNFRNNDVVKYFDDVFNFWLDHGLSGLYLDKVEYLVEDSNFLDERPSAVAGKVHDEYDFQYHSHTTHLQESWDLLSRWANVFKNHSAIFAVSGVPELKEADLIWRPINVKNSLKSAELKEMLLKRLNKTSQVWGFYCDDCDERVRIGLQAALLMLPGAVVIPSGLELGLPPSSIFQWDSLEPNKGFTKGVPWTNTASGYEDRSVASEQKNASSYYNNFREIIKERRNSLVHGMKNLQFLNSSMLAFTRAKSGSPHYLMALNIEENEQTLNLHEFLDNFPKMTLISGSRSDYVLPDVKNTTLVVPGTSYVILRYIPDTEE